MNWFLVREIYTNKVVGNCAFSEDDIGAYLDVIALRMLNILKFSNGQDVTLFGVEIARPRFYLIRVTLLVVT